MKVMVNRCYGGFGLNKEVAKRCIAKGHPEAIKQRAERDEWAAKEPKRKESIDLYSWLDDVARNDRIVIQVIEQMMAEGVNHNTPYSDVKIEEVDTDRMWTLEEYDGREWIEYPEPGKHGCRLE